MQKRVRLLFVLLFGQSAISHAERMPENTGSNGKIEPSPTEARPFETESTGDRPMIAFRQLTAIRDAVAAYRVVFKENPVGTNTEITRTLLGKNPRNAAFLNLTRVVVDHEELIDPWGKPYFFHQVSSRVMEIRSAGPNQDMWDQDDLTIR